MNDQWGKAEKVFIIGVGAFGGAALAALCGILTLKLTLPASDLAHDGPWWGLFVDPFVLTVAIPLAILGGVVAFAYGLFALWKTDLRKSVPVVVAVGVGSVALTAPVLSGLSGFVGIVAVFAALTWYWFVSRTESLQGTAPRQTSTPET